MMRVYLMQHGTPVSKEENPERPLSAEGKKDAEKMGDFLKKCGISVEEVFHSGKTRARETAEIMISKVAPLLRAEVKGGLSPLDDVKGIADHIQSTQKNLMIAGHLPHLAKLTSLLVTGDESAPIVRFQQGGVVCLEKDDGGKWAVAWMLVPEIIQETN
ncbi:MAG: phosphohistidine phosphatase SixA [Desulfobacteraceae bacterium]|jgi:phosphohistidine phosphatase